MKQNARPGSFDICLNAMKDCAAHKKFVKKSGLRYGGEMPRPKFARGPDGWTQWRMQFAPRQDDDTSQVETELNRLHDQRKLNDDEYARLRGLYGLDGHVTPQVPPSILTQPPSPSGGFCRSCGSKLMPGKKFCEKCGAPAPAKAAPSTNTKPPPPQTRLCVKCGAQLKPGKRFCEKCGAPVAQPVAPATPPPAPVCPSCGNTVPAGKKFCVRCGARMP